MLQITLNNESKVEVLNTENSWLVNGEPTNVDICAAKQGLISIVVNNKSYTGVIEKVDRSTKEVTVRVNNKVITASIKEPIDQLLSSMGLDLAAAKKAEPIKAPMPGLVLRILVTPGQTVHKGDGLLVLEAMKMENLLKATGTATVKSIKTTERTAVEKGTVLIELE